jgi:hypothetical protein
MAELVFDLPDGNGGDGLDEMLFFGLCEDMDV